MEIFAGSLTPVNKGNDKKIIKAMIGCRTNELINQYNVMLEDLCKKTYVTNVDINTSLQDKNGNLHIDYTTDGLHLNGAGYDVIVKEIKKQTKLW